MIDRSTSIGVRGQFTKEFLIDLGFDDASIDVIGSPSLHGFGGEGRLKERAGVESDSAIAVTYSPYLRDVGPFAREVTETYADSYVVPQTVEALALILWGEPTSHADKSDLPADHELYRSDRMSFFVDATTWIDTLRDRDLVVGTRIHGTIAGLLAGAPSILIAHDTRTRDLAEFPSIPHLLKRALCRVDVRRWYEEADFAGFTAAHAANVAGYRAFLDRHRLAHTLGEPAPRFDRELAAVHLALPVRTPLAAELAGRRPLTARLLHRLEGAIGATRRR